MSTTTKVLDYTAGFNGLDEILNAAKNDLSSLNTMAAFEHLGPKLNHFYMSNAEIRTSELKSFCQQHSVFPLIRQDPYSNRAFNKPRGYAGDAVMLDYVYGGAPPEGTSEVGKAVFAGTAGGPMGRSVAFRKSLLSAHLQSLCFKHSKARVLSVASGHCRELMDTPFLWAPRGDFDPVWEFWGLDQDPLSCRRVRKELHSPRVHVVNESIGALFTGNPVNEFGKFDFIYSAGLLDYLQDPTAARLITALGKMLKEGGVLLLANFTPDCYGRAFMELILDWKLVYRSSRELAGLYTGKTLNYNSAFEDPLGNVAYVTWKRPIAALGSVPEDN